METEEFDLCPKCEVGEMCYNDQGVLECSECEYIDPDDLEEQEEDPDDLEEQEEDPISASLREFADDDNGPMALDESLLAL